MLGWQKLGTERSKGNCNYEIGVEGVVGDEHTVYQETENIAKIFLISNETFQLRRFFQDLLHGYADTQTAKPSGREFAVLPNECQKCLAKKTCYEMGIPNPVKKPV